MLSSSAITYDSKRLTYEGDLNGLRKSAERPVRAEKSTHDRNKRSNQCLPLRHLGVLISYGRVGRQRNRLCPLSPSLSLQDVLSR